MGGFFVCRNRILRRLTSRVLLGFLAWIVLDEKQQFFFSQNISGIIGEHWVHIYNYTGGHIWNLPYVSSYEEFSNLWICYPYERFFFSVFSCKTKISAYLVTTLALRAQHNCFWFFFLMILKFFRGIAADSWVVVKLSHAGPAKVAQVSVRTHNFYL